MNRRGFLGTSTAALAATLLPTRATAQGGRKPETPTEAFDPWIEVHAPNLAHNVGEVSRAAGKRPILAVIKNNGYGLGVATVARLLEPLPEIAGFAVVKLEEAITLRDRGLKKPVLLMGPFTTGELGDAGRQGHHADGLHAHRRRSGQGGGFNRHGRSTSTCAWTPASDESASHTRRPPPLVRDLAARKNVRIAGVMMTFTEDQAFDQEQLQRFTTLSGELTAGGVALGRRHAASSYTFFQHDNAWLDMVRPGMVLYGVYPDPKFRAGAKLDPAPGGRPSGPRGLREEARRGHQRRLRARLRGQDGHMGGDAAGGPHRRLAARRGEGCPRPHQRPALSGHRVGLRQPHHCRDRCGADRSRRRHRDDVRLERRRRGRKMSPCRAADRCTTCSCTSTRCCHGS